MDWMHAWEALVDRDNQNGGWDVGGKKYKIQLVEYDNNSSQATETAAVNRLIFEDKVNYIVSFGQFEDAWLPLANDHKVLVLSRMIMQMGTGFLPKFNYVFNGGGMNGELVAVAGWLAEKYPEKANSIVFACPDNQMGHFTNMAVTASWKPFGIKSTDIFYPATQQDLSSLGTKVASQNPALFTAMTGSNADDGHVFNAVAQAGYKGQSFSMSMTSAQTLQQNLNKDTLQGFMSGAYAVEFDPPLTQTAKDLKAAWIAKFGKWEYPDVAGSTEYFCLKTALEKAGTVDTTKVADVISSGLQFETANGAALMVSRLDMGNSRTVDSVSTVYVKKVDNGLPVMLDTISADKIAGYMQKAYPPLPPGATPGGPPPGGPPGGAPPGGDLPPGGPPSGGMPPGGPSGAP